MVLPPRPPKACIISAEKADGSLTNLFISKSNIILLYYIAIYGNMARKFVNPLDLRIFYLILSGDDTLNNYTNYNTHLKLLQPEIYPARNM